MTIEEIEKFARDALALGELHAADIDDAYLQGFVGGWVAARVAAIPHATRAKEHRQ